MVYVPDEELGVAGVVNSSVLVRFVDVSLMGVTAPFQLV